MSLHCYLVDLLCVIAEARGERDHKHLCAHTQTMHQGRNLYALEMLILYGCDPTTKYIILQCSAVSLVVILVLNSLFWDSIVYCRL